MFVFFFKQKTAYEMRISYWSSDVCSSDLVLPGFDVALPGLRGVADELQVARVDVLRAVAVGLADRHPDRSVVLADQGAVQSVPAPRVQFDSQQADGFAGNPAFGDRVPRIGHAIDLQELRVGGRREAGRASQQSDRRVERKRDEQGRAHV